MKVHKIGHSCVVVEEEGEWQEAVWRCPQRGGGVTYTYSARRGVVGGRAVPLAAMLGEKICAPKKGEVIHFLKGYGLDQAGAERIVAKVGTAAK